MGLLLLASAMAGLRTAVQILSRIPFPLFLVLTMFALPHPARAQLALLDPGPATQFVVKGLVTPGGMGDEQLFSVLALDANQNIAVGYRGTVRFSSTDSSATLPASYTFTAADSGQKTFRIRFNSKSTHTVTATDAGNSSIKGTHAPVVINNIATISSSTVSYDSSTNSITVAGAFTVTLSDIKTFLPSAPLDLVSSGVWLLRANLLVQKGARLLLKGTSGGGDVNELRLLSNNSGSLITSVIYIEANYGRIEIDRTKIISWNQAANGPDTNHVTNDRAFLRAISALHSDGITKRESRMDILNSEIAYLGYDYNQRTSRGGGSYGLSWRVGGSQPDRFDKVDVFGDILNSNIHHGYFGHYSFGIFGAQYAGNRIYGHALYGIDGHDDSDYMLVHDNETFDNGQHGIICSQRCDHWVIVDNHSHDNDKHGIMLHRQMTASRVENNDVHNNADSGIALFDSTGNLVRNNTLSANGHGVRFSVEAADNFIVENTIDSNGSGFRFFKGTDTPTNSGADGRPKRNLFLQNTLAGNTEAIKLEEAYSNTFEKNEIAAGNGILSLKKGCANVFDGNVVAEGNSLALADGSCSSYSPPVDARVMNQNATRVQVANGSKVQFFSQIGAIFDFDGREDIATIYRTAGSELDLTTDSIGTSAVLLRKRDLGIAGMGSQSVSVVPVAWNLSGTERKEWSARTGSGTLNLGYALPNLAPNTSYRVRRNGVEQAILLSDAEGRLEFTGATGNSTVKFAVERSSAQ
jgi:parallel beta-helix repeat protein